MDEAFITVKGQWCSLSRAIDKQGQAIDFLPTEYRDKEAALRFLKKAIRRHRGPGQMTSDGSDTNEAAIKSYNEEHGTQLIIQQVRYLNHIVEQDHRAVKWVTKPILGFKQLYKVKDIIVLMELMHMLKKTQMVVEAGEESFTAAELFYSLAV